MTPVLVLLNGLPGSGKSTLARTWSERHASRLPLALDVDVLRSMLGGWREAGGAAGLAARAMALAAMRVHLDGGHDVVVPQFLHRPAFADDLERTATWSGSGFLHALLEVDPAVAAERLRRRDPGGAEGRLQGSMPVLAAELDRFVAGRSVVRIGDADALDAAVAGVRTGQAR